MGYTLEGFIARQTTFDGVVEPTLAVVDLPQQFVLVPLTDELRDSFPLGTTCYDSFYKLNSELGVWANELSRAGAIAYLEAELFGGTGTHAAVVWDSGKVAFGPLQTEVRWDGQKIIAPPLRDNAFNQALRFLGVILGDANDEFDALGLGRHRGTEKWAEESR